MSTALKALRTVVFRRQHREILDVVRQLETKLVVATIEQDTSDAIRGHLNELAGKLTVHLAMEDKALYPRLLVHGSPQLRKIAADVVRDMGGIQAVFREYVIRWSVPQRIQANAAEFIRETNEILEALKRRITREDTELYPMIDRES